MPASWAFHCRSGAHRRLRRPRLGLSTSSPLHWRFSPVGSRVTFTTSERGLPRALGLRGGVFPAPSLKTRQSGRRIAGASNGHSLSSIGIEPATAPSDDFQHADPTRPNQRLWQDHRAPTTSASLRVDPGGSQRHPRHPQATSAKLSIAHTPFELSL